MDIGDIMISIGVTGLICLLIVSIIDNHDERYKITAPGLSWHYTNNYTEDNGCVQFVEKDKETKYCSVYQVVENK